MKFTYIKRDIIMNTIKLRSRRRTIFTAAIALAAVASGLTPITCKADEYWDRKVSLFSVLPIEENDIVFLGNSITDGGEFNELFNRGDVKNRGISSDVITGVEKRLEQVTSGHPRKIFLLIGINDVSHGLSVGQLSERYERLVKKIRTQSPETELYVQSVMPINNDFHRYRNLTGRERTVVELNKCIRESQRKMMPNISTFGRSSPTITAISNANSPTTAYTSTAMATAPGLMASEAIWKKIRVINYWAFPHIIIEND